MGGVTGEDLRQSGWVPERRHNRWRRRTGLVQSYVAQVVPPIGDLSQPPPRRDGYRRVGRAAQTAESTPAASAPPANKGDASRVARQAARSSSSAGPATSS